MFSAYIQYIFICYRCIYIHIYTRIYSTCLYRLHFQWERTKNHFVQTRYNYTNVLIYIYIFIINLYAVKPYINPTKLCLITVWVGKKIYTITKTINLFSLLNRCHGNMVSFAICHFIWALYCTWGSVESYLIFLL